jgi:hypothetical protein
VFSMDRRVSGEIAIEIEIEIERGIEILNVIT